MAHLGLAKLQCREARLLREVPVGGEQQEQIIAPPMPLANLEHSLLPWNVIPAMSVDEHETAEAMLDKILEQSSQQIQIRPWWGRQRSGKVEMVIRVAEPRERCEQDAIADPLRRPADDFAKEQAVGEERQVMPVLFECGDGKHDRSILVERLDRRPCQFRELHGVLL
jgi:hypothetical protein